MALDAQARPIIIVPLATDSHGIVRVEGSRVTLDSIVVAFELGATAEEVVQRHPTLELGDVYAIIAFYLSHRAAVRAYLEGRVQQEDDVKRHLDALHPGEGLRERLLARRAHG